MKVPLDKSINLLKRILRKLKRHFKYYLKKYKIDYYRQKIKNLANYNAFLREDRESYAILRKKIDVKDFWEESHIFQSELWLTGTDPGWLFDYHDINDVLSSKQPKLKILNVGVGKGTCTKALYDTGHEIYALDISETALENISKYVEKSYLASSPSDLPTEYFDLVIHHLVSQHMSILDLREQSKHLARSLKIGGILSMQTATFEDAKRNDVNDSPRNCKKGSVGRSEKEIRNIFNIEGLNITEVTLTHTFPEYGSAWFRVKVTKGE
jgi:2-polyprenyl-3-methyl-5-hydroxy-6-metoxy-1,4-benzoquinol methylase